MTATLDRRVQVLKLAREFDLIILEGEGGFICNDLLLVQ